MITVRINQWFAMSEPPRPDVFQVLVFDSRTSLYKCVTIREDGFWQEESGKIYDPKFATFYTRWTSLKLRDN